MSEDEEYIQAGEHREHDSGARAGRSPEEAGVRADSVVEARSSPPVVLVVDDEEDVADTYALWLTDDYDVRTAYSGREALDRLDEDVDVVLLDRRMPDIPGDEVLERIRERDLDCQVSMLTAVDPDTDLTELRFDEYLVKPVTRSDVVEVVNELLLRQSFEEETQEYLALKSAADSVEEHAPDSVRESEAVAELHDQVETAGESPTVQEESAEFHRLKALTDLVRSVNRLVVEVETRSELDRKVCRKLVENTPDEYALVGEYTDPYEEFVPRATSTEVDGSAIDPVSCGPDDPVRTALDSEEVQVVDLGAFPESTVATLGSAVAGDDRPGSAIVIPITYRETVRGAVVLWSDERSGLSDHERDVLLEVGKTIGNAADSLRTRELVHADRVVELELEVTDRTDVFVDLSSEYDCRIQLDGVNLSSEAGIVCYLTVSGGPSDDIVEFLVEREGIDTCRVIDDRGDDLLVECTVRDSSLPQKLVEVGGTVTDVFVDGGQGTVSLQMPQDLDLRAALESVNEEFPNVDLVSKRVSDRSQQSVEGFRAALESELTERQETVLNAAYDAGYFDWPRGSTAEEVAEGLGMAPPTFHEHIREALRKLVETYRDETE